MHIEQIDRVLSIFPFFTAISHKEWQNSGASIMTLPAQLMIEEGHIFEHASFVLNGCIRIYKVSPSGKELTLYRLKSGETCVIMIASVLGETEYEALAETEEETELLLLPVSIFKHWMDTQKEINQFIYRLFIKRMLSVTNRIEDLTFKPINHRVAELLLRKTNRFPDVPLYITHQSLSLELGTAREVVSRVLKEFERHGWVRLGRGKIYVVQRYNLEQLIKVK